MTLPVLETERLWLKIPDSSYASRMSKFAIKNREHFKNSMPLMEESYYTEIYWSVNLLNYRDAVARGEGYCFVLFNKNDNTEMPIGICNFDKIVRGVFQACYLGYKIDQDFVGQGLMYEAVKRGVQFMFEEVGLHRIMAAYMPSNERSGKLLNKSGFKIEGYAKDYLLINGKWEDHILTAITNENYSTLRKI